jgi:hypothetical protein
MPGFEPVNRRRLGVSFVRLFTWDLCLGFVGVRLPVEL